MGRWTCTIIQNTETGKYRVADFRINGKDVEECLKITESHYKPLVDEVRRVTGICLLKRRDMIFERLSDFENIATLDVTQYRGEEKDCQVTIKERIAGWQPCFDWKERKEMNKRNVIESISNKQLTKKDIINMINNAFPDEEVGTHGTIATVTMTELTDGTIMESVTFGKRLYCE